MKRTSFTALVLLMLSTVGCGTLGSLGNMFLGDEGKAILIKNHQAVVVNARPEILEINAVAKLVDVGGVLSAVICVGEMEAECEDWRPRQVVWLNEARQERAATEIVFEVEDTSICGDRICGFDTYYLLESGRKAR